MKVEKHNYPSVHKGVVRAALMLVPPFYTEDDKNLLIEYAAVPDNKNDRLNGKGKHYYCAQNAVGKPYKTYTDKAYYLNGSKKLAPSLRTMFESEYLTAIAMYKLGKRYWAMDSLMRAAHMLADVCCPPHSCEFTYFSPYGKYHQRYEGKAASVFWGEDGIDEEKAAKKWAEYALKPATPTRDFMKLFNDLSLLSGAEINNVVDDDIEKVEDSIYRQLKLTIQNLAMLFTIFIEDVQSENVFYLKENTAYTLCQYGEASKQFEEVLYVEYDEDNLFSLKTKDGRYLCLKSLGRVVFTDDIKKGITKFTLGVEGANVLYPMGNPDRFIGFDGKHFECRKARNLNAKNTFTFVENV
ncbi:MAG: hypothetical protein E7252_01670 [Lachnospira sp.]|nr:hypothetical protein [Lachnospira sp.]